MSTTGSHIPIQIHQPPKQVRRSNPARFSNEATNDELVRQIEILSKDFTELQNKYNELVKYSGENQFKINNLIKTIERTQQASGNSVITQINNSGGGSGSGATTGSEVRTQLIAAVAGTPIPVVFEQASELMSVECYYDEGDYRYMFQYGINETGLPASISINPSSSGFCRVTYKFL